jgi:hypothetical protein
VQRASTSRYDKRVPALRGGGACAQIHEDSVMTTPSDRFRAIAKTRHFLKALTDPKRTPSVPKPLRDEATRCLRHFPSPSDMDEAIHGLALAAKVWAAVEPLPRRNRRPPPVD